jgi:hypothetical protein
MSQNFVGGRWSEASKSTPNVNPSNARDVIGEYARGTKDDANRWRPSRVGHPEMAQARTNAAAGSRQSGLWRGNRRDVAIRAPWDRAGAA